MKKFVSFIKREFGFYQEKDLYKTFRIYLFFAAVFTPGLTFVFYTESPTRSFWIDIVILISFVLSLFLSFTHQWFRNHLRAVFFSICYFSSVYAFVNMYSSDYNIEDFIGFLLVFFAVNIGMLDHRYSLFYSISFLLISTITALFSKNYEIDPRGVVVLVFIVGVVSFIIHYSKYILVNNLKKNRDELIGNRDQMITVLDSIDKIVYNVSIDEKGVKTLRYVSNTIEEILGISVEDYFTEIKAGRIIERIHPDDLPAVIDASRTLSEQKIPVSMIYRFRKENGYIWIEEKVFPKFDLNGRHIASIGITSDIHSSFIKELQLKKSEEQYRSMIERNLAGFYRMTLDDIIIECNDAFARIIGFNYKEEVLGQNINTLYLDSTDKDQFTPLLREKEFIINHESNISLLSGKNIWLLENVALIRNSAGEPDYIEGTVFDVTELKTAELKIRSAEENLRMVIDNIDSLVYSLEIDERGKKKFNFIGPQIEKLIGISREQYINEVQSGEINNYFHPDDIGDVVASIRNIKTNQSSGVFTYRFKVRPSNEYRWLEEAMFPHFNEEGRLIRNFGVVRDISDKKKFEDTLRQSELNYRTLFERNLAGVFRTTIDGKILECNEAFLRIFMYDSKEEMLNINSYDFYFDKAARDKYIEDLNKEGFVTNYELYNRRKDGSAIRLLANVSMFKDDQILIGTIIDITDLKEAEEKILESKKAYEQLVEGSPYGIFIHREGKVLYANNAAFEIIGLDKQNFVPAKFSMYDFLLPEYVEESNERRKRILEGEDVPFIRIRLRTTTGDVIDVETKSQLIIYEDTPSIQTTIKNISAELLLEKEKLRAEIAEQTNELLAGEIREHKATQTKLMETQQYLSNIIESSIDMIIASGTDDTIIQINSAAINAFGYSPGEIIGKNAGVLYSDAGDFEKVKKALTVNGSFSGEISNIRKNGEVFISYISASLIRDASGNVIGAMGVSRDITEIIEAEKIVQEQNAKIKSIFENSSNMLMWTVDRDFRLTSFNKNYKDIMEQRYGVPVFYGANVLPDESTIPDESDRLQITKGYEHAFNGYAQEFEGPIFGSGKSNWFETFLNPIRLDSGEIEEISCMAHDITEKKIAENDLINSLKEKEVLLKEVHHRVKNNLQVISSILNLQSSYVRDEGTLQILRESQNRIKSMSFIHESLYQTKMFSSVNFSEYIYNLSKNLVHSYQVFGDLVDLEFTLGDIHLNLDQSIPCGLIVNELVSNALKYAFEKGQKGMIWIGLEEKDNEVLLLVRDNGKGLPEGFDHNTTETLGLQLVATLVEQLEGTMQLESAPGKGTKYLITFDKLN